MSESQIDKELLDSSLSAVVGARTGSASPFSVEANADTTKADSPSSPEEPAADQEAIDFWFGAVSPARPKRRKTGEMPPPQGAVT